MRKKKGNTASPAGNTRHVLMVGMVLAVLLLVWIYFGNRVVGVTRLTISDSQLPSTFDAYTIAHISDLHNDYFGDNQSQLLEKLGQAKPDLIVVTGDLIDSRRTDLAPAMALMERAVQLAPVYYVTGNHEGRVYTSYQQLEEQMLAVGVHILHQESVRIEHDGEQIQLVGLDDPQFPQLAKAKQLEQLVDRDSYTLLLSHRPELFDRYVQAGVNLAFCGHAHGGQFRIPFLGGVIAPNQGLFPAYSEGMVQSGQTTMVVSRGLGNSIFPFRVNNPPELVVMTLKTLAS